MTFTTAQRTPFFRNERWAIFFLNVLRRYQENFLLHDFVIMHDHVHVLATPVSTLEKTAQLIKGGFSFLAKREFQWNRDIWQAGFSDHRIRDFEELQRHYLYIAKNVSSLRTEEYRFCGCNAGLPLDEVPQWLKPRTFMDIGVGAEAPTFQSFEADTEQSSGASKEARIEFLAPELEAANMLREN